MSDSESSEFIWTPAYEVQLMFAMIGLKPVGVNQHFYMARIQEKFSAAINRTVEPETIWKHLNTWYDMEKLDEMEPFPFPIDEVDFELPEDEFGELMEQVKKNGSRFERVENQRRGLDDIKKDNAKEDAIKDAKENMKEDDGGNRNKNKLDKKAPLRRVSKSDKNDSSGAEESREKDEEKVLPGGRTRRSIKVEEPSKEDSNDSAKRTDLNSAKKQVSKKEVGSEIVKKKSGSDPVDLNKSDLNLKRPASRTPVKSSKEPEKTPKRVTRASFTPNEMESAKKKRKR